MIKRNLSTKHCKKSIQSCIKLNSLAMSLSTLTPAKKPENIVVVGGGIIGVCSAYFLKRDGKDLVNVTIVEGTEIAAGASGKAGGLLALDWHGASTASLAELSYKLHSDLASQFNGTSQWGYRQLETLSVRADLSKTPNGINHQKGNIDWSSSSSSSPPKERAKKSSEGSFEWLDQTVLTGTSQLGSKKSTAQVHPSLFTNAIAKEAEKLGVTTLIGTVDGIKQLPSGDSYTVQGKRKNVSGAHDSQNGTNFSIEADKVVIAAGPWTGSLLDKLALPSGKKFGPMAGGRARRITGSRAHSVVIRPVLDNGKQPLPAQALFTSIKMKSGGGTHEPEIYNRPDGTAYACGATDDSPLPDFADEVTTDPAAIQEILSHVAGLAPDYLRTSSGTRSNEVSKGGGGGGGGDGVVAHLEKEQACYLPVGSGDPVIGKISGFNQSDSSNGGIWVASGHSCWGITNGPGTGQVVAELLLDLPLSADIAQLKP